MDEASRLILMRMFGIWCDDNIHAIMATREAAIWLLDCLEDNDGDCEHTWSIHPVNVSADIAESE